MQKPIIRVQCSQPGWVGDGNAWGFGSDRRLDLSGGAEPIIADLAQWAPQASSIWLLNPWGAAAPYDTDAIYDMTQFPVITQNVRALVQACQAANPKITVCVNAMSNSVYNPATVIDPIQICINYIKANLTTGVVPGYFDSALYTAFDTGPLVAAIEKYCLGWCKSIYFERMIPPAQHRFGLYVPALDANYNVLEYPGGPPIPTETAADLKQWQSVGCPCAWYMASDPNNNYAPVEGDTVERVQGSGSTMLVDIERWGNPAWTGPSGLITQVNQLLVAA